MKRTVALYLSLLTIASFASSCTNYVPAKLYMTRSQDTLAVALDTLGGSRWDPVRDSLVVYCNGCDPENSRIVEHFRDRNDAAFEISNSRSVTLTLYTMGHADSTFLVTGTGAAVAGEPLPRLRSISPRHRAVIKSEADATAPHKITTPEKPKAVTLKVTAPEGVAVYKDKSKKEVLKILPQGSTLPIVAQEGDLYSVSVDGEEGFVEAEAVQVQ